MNKKHVFKIQDLYMVYDTIIIGAGPAGFSAAIYAARREMKTLIISKDIGGQLILASSIENYPGFKKIDSFELTNKMEEHVKDLGVEIKNAEVQIIKKNGDNFTLHTSNEEFNSKTVIVAMGLSPRRLAIQGEDEFTGKGVSYCSNCDGPLFRNKVVAVIGGGNSALDAAEVLSKIASKVYLVHRSDEFKAFEALVSKVENKDNIEIILNSDIKEILGSTKVEKIKIKDNQEEKMIDVDGVFIEIGRIAHTDLFADLVKLDERKQIVIDELCQTTQPGIFAAGDVTPVKFKQISIACGHGTIAALAAYQYLQLKQGKSSIVSDRSPFRKNK